MTRFVLSEDDVNIIRHLLSELTAQHQHPDDSSFLNNVTVYAQELPRGVRMAMNEFRLAEKSAVLVISGFPIDEDSLGPTPSSLEDARMSSRSVREEFLFALLASLLGDIIGWRTQHGGRIIHDVFPIKAHAQEQIGTGSEQLIWWHTEDAFHELRGDYVGLMCLRNPDAIATTICPLSCVPLTKKQTNLLFMPVFTIRPDESHQRKNAVGLEVANGEPDGDFDHIEEMLRNPRKVALFSGSQDSPYIRIDPYFMDPSANSEAQEAVCQLIQAIDQRIQKVVLAQGDVCFIDNYRAVHGRKSFKARFDGTDRWLKRINVTRDLRKSRSQRSDALSRIIA
ncbi:MAG TPA: guanitoxin biosynthesis L-enduracididine beta-hydroxylase GntD [Candidatus Angelobacter sp.]|jgi:Fe(II)/alpha-ketoglutarate-dependent arginine beta-hydroxylase